MFFPSKIALIITFVRDRDSVRGSLHPLALDGVVTSFGAPRRRAHLVTAVPGEAFGVIFPHLFGVYWSVAILVMVCPEVVLLVAAYLHLP